MRIVIADEHPSFRNALKAFLLTDPSLSVVGEADSVSDLLDVVVEQKPDVVIMEAFSPELPGLQLLPWVRHASPQTRVILLSTVASAAEAEAAERGGAVGYLSKELVVRDLFDALWAAYHYVHPHRVEGDAGADEGDPLQSLDGFILAMPSSRLEVDEKSGVGRLSRYERYCLSMLAEGRSLAQMAEALNLPLTALEMCRRRLMLKLGVETPEQLQAIAAGLIAPGA